jgi:hypothetical protein
VRAEERALEGAYLAQGLALVTLGFAEKLTGPRLAAVFAVESAALLAQVKRRHGWIYEIAAGLCALAACGLTVMELGWHAASPIALGGPVAALLFFDAWWIKRQRGELASGRFSERAFVFAVLGLAVVGAVLWQKVDEAWLPAACALVSVASLAALRVRLREIAFPGQAFLFAGLALFLARTTQTLPSPWWSPLPLIVVALGLMHWWQREQTVKLKTEPQSAIALAFAAAAATAGLCWMRAFCHGDAWLWATSAAALGTLLYGWLTEAWPLAWAGQIFSIVASVSFVGALVDGRPAWAAALAPVVNLALTSALLSRARFVSNDDWLLQRLAQFYHLAAMASAWLWVTRWTDSHGEAEHLTVAWALLALVIFAAGLGLRERLYRAGGFAVLGLAVGRLFVVDVWRFDTLPRIVSFLVLGGVLLALSFVYNRFAEALRRWL